jgi:predicted O-methyltransferase YrrM
MKSVLQRTAKLPIAARTVLDTSFNTWQTARNACKHAANQRWSELSRLIHLLRRRELSRVLEIGVSGGGTLALWAQLAKDDAHLIGLDLTIPASAQELVNSKRRPQQSVQFIQGDSHGEGVRREIALSFRDQPLDFLFVDGDHSYEGVKKDWEMYSPMVRRGGLVAFHEIVPDHGTRFGTATESDAGGVFRFWVEVKQGFRSCEFVEDAAQDGYGIGVVFL